MPVKPPRDIQLGIHRENYTMFSVFPFVIIFFRLVILSGKGKGDGARQLNGKWEVVVT